MSDRMLLNKQFFTKYEGILEITRMTVKSGDKQIIAYKLQRF